jgi:hypothetical protein
LGNAQPCSATRGWALPNRIHHSFFVYQQNSATPDAFSKLSALAGFPHFSLAVYPHAFASEFLYAVIEGK